MKKHPIQTEKPNHLGESDFELLRLQSGGAGNREIAEALCKSEFTVHNQLCRLCKKTRWRIACKRFHGLGRRLWVKQRGPRTSLRAKSSANRYICTSTPDQKCIRMRRI